MENVAQAYARANGPDYPYEPGGRPKLHPRCAQCDEPTDNIADHVCSLPRAFAVDRDALDDLLDERSEGDEPDLGQFGGEDVGVQLASLIVEAFGGGAIVAPVLAGQEVDLVAYGDDDGNAAGVVLGVRPGAPVEWFLTGAMISTVWTEADEYLGRSRGGFYATHRRALVSAVERAVHEANLLLAALARLAPAEEPAAPAEAPVGYRVRSWDGVVGTVAAVVDDGSEDVWTIQPDPVTRPAGTCEILLAGDELPPFGRCDGCGYVYRTGGDRCCEYRAERDDIGAVVRDAAGAIVYEAGVEPTPSRLAG